MKKLLLSVLASSLFCSSLYAAELTPLQSDTEPDRTDWTQLDSKYGALPKVDSKLKTGGVSKTLTNEYWRSLGEGYQNVAKKIWLHRRLSGRRQRRRSAWPALYR
ncbi:hypothetical protein OJE16_01335 [Pantoea tagorei]